MWPQSSRIAVLLRSARGDLVSTQFATFVVVGAAAACLHWLFRYVLSMYLPYSGALALAYVMSIGSAFLLNRRFVFPMSPKPVRHQIAYFTAFNIAMFPVVYGIAFLLSEHLLAGYAKPEVARGIGHGIAVLCPAVVNFFFQKYVSFDA